MDRILKYNLPLKFGDTTLKIPGNSEFLSCQIQWGVPALWYKVRSDTPPALPVVFRVAATGEEIPPSATHVATLKEGYFVFHVFRLVT